MARLHTARFYGVDLSNATFVNTSSVAFTFYFADLKNVDFSKTRSQLAAFRWSNLRGANIQGMRRLSKSTFQDSVGDMMTKIPQGEYLPTCFQTSDEIAEEIRSRVSTNFAENFLCGQGKRQCLAGWWPGEVEGFRCCEGDESAFCKKAWADWRQHNAT